MKLMAHETLPLCLNKTRSSVFTPAVQNLVQPTLKNSSDFVFCVASFTLGPNITAQERCPV